MSRILNPRPVNPEQESQLFITLSAAVQRPEPWILILNPEQGSEPRSCIQQYDTGVQYHILTSRLRDGVCVRTITPESRINCMPENTWYGVSYSSSVDVYIVYIPGTYSQQYINQATCGVIVSPVLLILQRWYTVLLHICSRPYHACIVKIPIISVDLHDTRNNQATGYEEFSVFAPLPPGGLFIPILSYCCTAIDTNTIFTSNISYAAVRVVKQGW